MTKDFIDVIPDTNDARLDHLSVPDHGRDYVVRGLQFRPNFDRGTLSIGGGELVIVDGGELYYVDFTQRVRGDALELPAGQRSDVYYAVDEAGGEVSGGVVVGSVPAEPRLRIGSVDTSAETFDDSVGRDPSQSFGSTDIDDAVITGNALRNPSERYYQSPTGYIEDAAKYDSNPIIEASDVTAFSADFVADPWGVVHDGTIYVFMEVEHSSTQDVMVAESDDAGRSWTVRNDLGSLRSSKPKFPQVVRWGDRFYMVGGYGEMVYTTVDDFPAGPNADDSWASVGASVDQFDVGADCSLVRHNGIWYMFGPTTFYYATDLDGGNWMPGGNYHWHVSDFKSAMMHQFTPPGADEGGLIYGNYQNPSNAKVQQFIVTDLSTTSVGIAEQGTVLESTQSWSNGAVHQLSTVRVDDEWVHIYDGVGAPNWKIGVAFEEVTA